MSQQPPERNDDQSILAITVLFGIVIALLFVVFASQPIPAAPPEVALAQTQAAVTAEPTAAVVEPTVAVEPAPDQTNVAYTTDQAQAGARIYNSLCFACHGQGGVGVAGLGKPLLHSEFVDGMTDDELVHFLVVGRQPTDPLNTTGQLMPARGGNPALTDTDLFNVVVYIRSLNGAQIDADSTGGTANSPTATPQIVSTATAPEDWVAPPINALDPGVVPAGTVNTGTLNIIDTTDGAQLYVWYCQACHGAAGAGVNGEAVLAGTGANYGVFTHMLLMPAAPGSPEETGFVHPYRGGAPGMSNEQIQALVAYLQSLDS